MLHSALSDLGLHCLLFTLLGVSRLKWVNFVKRKRFYLFSCLYYLQDSLSVIPSALVDVSVKDSKVYDHFQFERLGFFTVDRDTNTDKVGYEPLDI